MHKIIIILVLTVCYIRGSEVEDNTENSAMKEEIPENIEDHEMEDGPTDEKKDKTEEEEKEKKKGEDEEGDNDDLYMEDSEEDDEENPDEQTTEDDTISYEQKMIQQPLEVIIRCSRRFTPGICLAPVVSVWTYVFDQQNCTERLGCHQVERANRFHNYNRCNRMCMALSNVYSKVLDMEKYDKDVNKREFGLPRRFGGIQLNDIKDMTDLPPLSKTSSENDNRPLARQYLDYAERHQSLSYDDYTPVAGAADLVPPDIDDFRVQSEVWDDFYRNFE